MKFTKKYLVEIISAALVLLLIPYAKAQDIDDTNHLPSLTDYSKGHTSEYSLPYGYVAKAKNKSINFVGYLTGFTKQGINPTVAQPIYGITLQKQFTKFIAVESNCFYSQRMNGHNIQSDYLSFMALAKFGYFGNKVGVYTAYGLSLNPSLTHANKENHTYGSFGPAIGTQLKLFKSTWIEGKVIYDCGLSGAYYKDGDWSDYKGIIIMTTLKFKI